MLGEPYIPETIIVHLGEPDENAKNIIIDFVDYVKNVASSILFPTWPENSIRANIYIIVSYALNRIYTEWYPRKGYNFDITSSVQFDQAFVEGRVIYDSISVIVDESFNDYIRKKDSSEPFSASLLNCTITTCSGLVQWGTVNLANSKLTPYEIITNYCGTDIDIIKNAPVKINTPSYPGENLQIGSNGNSVDQIQLQLNCISTSYTAIPKIFPIDGIYALSTENAVKEFQRIFHLHVTGVVDKATWYKIALKFASVKKLSELKSEDVNLKKIQRQLSSENLKPEDTGTGVTIIQYYLSLISNYYQSVMPTTINSKYDSETENSVKSFQKLLNLPVTGIVDEVTWKDINRVYIGIVENVPAQAVKGEELVLYPGFQLIEGMANEFVKILQENLSYIHKTYPEIPDVKTTGFFGPLTKNSVIAYQNKFGIKPTGTVCNITWDSINNTYSDFNLGYKKMPEQYPGYIIK